MSEMTMNSSTGDHAMFQMSLYTQISDNAAMLFMMMADILDANDRINVRELLSAITEIY
jgi:hypothetical protein